MIPFQCASIVFYKHSFFVVSNTPSRVVILSTFPSEAQDEWKGWHRMGDPVLHIELRNWADIIVVAPLSAHTLAKIATGMCDDPLTCCIRAWYVNVQSSLFNYNKINLVVLSILNFSFLFKIFPGTLDMVIVKESR